jgi:fumarate reductase flavoprotein subunit
MATHNPDSKDDRPQSSWENKGDGIKMAQAIGADTVFKGGKVGWVGIDTSLGEAMHYYSAVIKGDGSLLDLSPPAATTGITTNKAGKQVPALTAATYAQHPDDYAVVHRRMLDARKLNEDETFWAITNTPANEVYKSKGFAFQETSIAALAGKIGADATKLQTSFASGQQIGNMMGPSTNLVATGTVFTATKAIPSSIGSMGGIKINTNAQVLKSGAPITGLYAAGECANGDMFYLEYPASGSSLSVSATFGRTAGAQAAAGL